LYKGVCRLRSGVRSWTLYVGTRACLCT